MIFIKTAAGQQAFKERHGTLSLRQRSAFILFDGKRTLEQVLAATTALGVGWDDVRHMIDAGLLELAEAAPAPKTAKATTPVDVAVAGAGNERSPSERYQAGYLVASELTAGLGLGGIRLHLAVEGATGYESLAALAPKIREAVGDARYTKLERALFA